MTIARLEEAFRAAIAACGLTPPDRVFVDGTLHRFSTNGLARDNAGWYVVHDGDLPAGIFGDWRSGLQSTWCARSRDSLTQPEKQALRASIHAAKRARDEAIAACERRATELASRRWSAATPAVTHPYLTRKGVPAYGVRQQGGLLLIPLRDTGHQLRSLQTIAPDGTKRFLAGGRVRGCYHAIGKLTAPLVICEGYATGASIHQATQLPVAVAFNSGNLEQAAAALRHCHPELSIIVAADDDWCTLGNPGLKAAHRAALASGCAVVKPLFTPPRARAFTDFNDLHNQSGLEIVRSFFTPLGELV